jgi:hypothetical protein
MQIRDVDELVAPGPIEPSGPPHGIPGHAMQIRTFPGSGGRHAGEPTSYPPFASRIEQGASRIELCVSEAEMPVIASAA